MQYYGATKATIAPKSRPPWGTGHHGRDLDQIDELRSNGYRVVSVVRNHWDVMVSWYYHTHKGQMERLKAGAPATPPPDFRDWLYEWVGPKRQMYLQERELYFVHQPVSDIIIEYEDMYDAWSEIANHTAHIPVIGKSPREPYRSYYDATLRDFIGSQYAEEIERYGYSF